MCTPMGYLVGRNFRDYKSKQWEHEIDKKIESNNYAFVPFMCAVILPLGAILAISQLITES